MMDGSGADGTGLALLALAIPGGLAILALGLLAFHLRQERDRAEGRLRATLNHIDQGVIIIDAGRRCDIYNRKVLDLLELPEALLARRPQLDEIVDVQDGRGEFATTSPGTRGEVLATIRSTQAAGYERARPNGAVIEVVNVPLPDGASIRTYRDVTAERRAVEDMNASMAFANSLVNASPDCIQLLDLDGHVIFISDLGRELFEIDDFESVRGQPFSMFFPEEHHGRVALALRRVRDGQTDRFTRMCPTLAGMPKWWDFIITPVHEIGRPPERLFVVARDISARQAHALELGRAKKAAERASQAKTQFLASMSHEIRTPLNAILGFAALARTGPDRDPDLQRQIALIEKAGETLLTIINDVLDLSKIEAGRIELEERSFSLRGLVEDCLSLMRGLADQKGLRLRCSVDDAIPERIVADEARIRQVVLNLLNNAVKFTPAGSVELRVGCEPAGTRMRIAVVDTGIGISAEGISRLFQDFVQVDGSSARHYGGTGLGLSISRRLVTLMGGEIGCSSVLGEGSTFSFDLPLVEANRTARADGAIGPAEPVPVTPRTILLVDDLSINLEIVSEMLASAGHRVTAVSNGPAAIAAYREGRYDIVLMDVQMPDMDGLETTRRLRDIAPQARRVPIIALTANVFSQQVESYREAGMNDHLGKPFGRDALLDAIERWTGQAAQDQAPTDGAAALGTDPGEVLDRVVMDELDRLLGGAKVAELLGRLQAELPSRLRSASVDALRADAHVMASAAGLLGFARLSAAAKALEQAIIDGGDPAPPLCALLAERSAALACIKRLLVSDETTAAA